MIASFLLNKFHAYGGFLFLNVPSLPASLDATHFGKGSFVKALILSSLTQNFNCRRAEVWKSEIDISRAWHSDQQYEDAIAVDPGERGLASRAIRHILHVNLRSALDQPDRCDVVDDLNKELVLVLSESR
jgi:hypothetical protein